MIELVKRFGRPFLRELTIGPASKLVEVVFDLFTPLVVALMIDRGVGSRSVESLLLYGALLVAMALAGFGSTLICQKMAARASQGLGTDVREALFKRINEFSYAELDRFGTPSLVTRLTNDVNQVQLALALAIRQLTRFPLLAIGSMIAAVIIDAKLGLVFLVATVLIGGVFWLVMARCVPYFKKMQKMLDRIALVTREGLTGVRVIRAFVREDHERERFERAANEQADIAIAVGRLSSILNPATFLVMNLAVCAILWVGGLQVNVGELTQGQVMAFVNYMTQTLLAIVYVANLVVVFTKASASADRILEVLDCVPTICSSSSARHLSADSGANPIADPHRETPSPAFIDSSVPALRLRGVSFAYPKAAAYAVSEVTLELACGGTLGVIGGTGSGKSTLASLIPRLYDASRGTVEVFGKDVRSWDLGDLRRSIGFVPQNAELVSGTIRSNLCWRDSDATDDELMDALAVAQADEFVTALPLGLDAPVETGGKNFSGGQRQRLTVARALVGNPRLLILDDAASALDYGTDAALRRSIHALARKEAAYPLTTVIVSQRVSSVRDADLICVMRHGRVVGLGAHDELIETCEVYREIVESQLGGGPMPALASLEVDAHA